MAETIPGTTPVKDQRPAPRGVLPRHAQSWLMVIIAVGILGVILFTGNSAPPTPATRGPRPMPAVPDPDGLRSYEERLRLLNEQARRQSTETAPAPTAPPDPQPNGYAGTDPLAAERRRLDYQSLFTPTMLHGGDQTARETRVGQSAQAAIPAGPSAGAPTTLDEVAAAVIRAMPTPQASAAFSAPPSAPTPPAANTPSSTASPVAVAPPLGDARPRYRLRAGTVIPTGLRNRLQGTFAGPVICMVTSPVYDLPTHRILIPAGAVLLGNATPVQSVGQERLAVTFHTLQLPDRSEYPLEDFVGANQAGDVGLLDRVDRHYLSTFGTAAAVGLLQGLATAVGTSALGSTGQPTIIIGGTTTEATNAMTRTVDHLLNRLPTVTIGEGHRVHVYLTKALDLPAFVTTSPTDDVFTQGARR